MISAKFGWDWLSSFRGEDFFLIYIYYRIFYELWTFTDFDRLWNLKKRGDEIKKKSSPLKLLSQSQPNFAEIILRWSPFKIVSVSARIISAKFGWNWLRSFRGEHFFYFIPLFSISSLAAILVVQLHCYWKQLWSMWSITGSWEPLVVLAPV
jgi:hypothetical protein